MKILLDNHHGIGDVAMFISVINGIKMNMPDSEIHMILKTKVEQNLVETVGGVTKFYYYRSFKDNFKYFIKLMFDLRKNHYDLGICHIGVNSKLGSSLLKAVGCKMTLGADSKSKYFNYTIPIDVTGQPFRARKNALLLQGLGVTDVQEMSLLKNLAYPGNITKKIISCFGQNTTKVGICIGTGNTIIKGVSVDGKRWPDQNWLALIERFIGEGIKVILFGGPKEKQERDARFNKLPCDVVMNFVGEVTLAESLEAISNCNLLIACDTGLGFCAGLMDVPSISLLGPSDPFLALPCGKYAECIYLGLDCSPCYGTVRMKDCKDRKCMKQITVDMVYEKSKQILSRH